MFPLITDCCTNCGNTLSELEKIAYTHTCADCKKTND